VNRRLRRQFVSAGGRQDHPLWMMATEVIRAKVPLVAIPTQGKSTARDLKACVAAGLAARPRVSTAQLDWSAGRLGFRVV
jgi:hypothetical protein